MKAHFEASLFATVIAAAASSAFAAGGEIAVIVKSVEFELLAERSEGRQRGHGRGQGLHA